MVRMSKQGERRAKFPRRRGAPQPKTGSLQDRLPEGYKPHANALEGDLAASVFIPKIK